MSEEKGTCRPLGGGDTNVMPGWGCCKCRVYNGLQRSACKNCKHQRCDAHEDAVPVSDVVVVFYNAGGGKIGDADPAVFPWELEVVLDAPEPRVTFCMLYGGTERLVIRGKTREALTELAHDAFGNHPRFIRVVITGPDGKSETTGSPAPK